MAPKKYPTAPVVLVDDDEAILKSTSRILKTAGINNIRGCQDPTNALTMIGEDGAEVVLLDLSMPRMSGEELLGHIQEQFPGVPVIIVTASGEVETAVRCMQNGAFDYMVKAVEPSRLTSGVKRAIELRSLARQYSQLQKNILNDDINEPAVFLSILTKNHRMQAIFRYIETIAPTSETILITGETGTGKELLAEAIHEASGRTGELVKVNTAGLDETMFTDSLFGHEKGAYTGAEQARGGLVQQAEEGTLFLDEIGDLSGPNQIKLLRLLESGEYYALGSDLVRATSARFVLATNRNLPEMVGDGEFRRDLYFRLQTYEIRVPPLREKKEDLPLLLDHFLTEAAEKLGKKVLAVPPELLILLENYDYPGNVRELRSMIFNAVSRQREKMLSMGPFREAMGHTGELPSIPVESEEFHFPVRLPTIKTLTEQLIQEALERSKGNQAIAAGMLGLTPQALSKRLVRKTKGE